MAEHHYHHDDAAGNGSLAAILIALLVIVGLAVFALRILPLQGNTAAGDSNRLDINLETPVVTPTNPAATPVQ